MMMWPIFLKIEQSKVHLRGGCLKYFFSNQFTQWALSPFYVLLRKEIGGTGPRGDLSNWGLLPTKNLFIHRTRIERILSKNPVFLHFHFDSIHRLDWPTGGPVGPKGASGVEKEKELRASGVDLFIFLFVNIFFGNELSTSRNAD